MRVGRVFSIPVEQFGWWAVRQPNPALPTAEFRSRGILLLRPPRAPRPSAPPCVGSSPRISQEVLQDGRSRCLGGSGGSPWKAEDVRGRRSALRALFPGSARWRVPPTTAPRDPLQPQAFALSFLLLPCPRSPTISIPLGISLNVTFSRSSLVSNLDQILKSLHSPHLGLLWFCTYPPDPGASSTRQP